MSRSPPTSAFSSSGISRRKQWPPSADGFVHKPAACITFAASGDKAARTAVHAFFKRPGNAQRVHHHGVRRGGAAGSAIRLSYHAQGKKRKRGDGRQQQQQQRDAWPSADERFCRFALHKENMDSGAALALLGRSLHCAPGALGCAGTKDRRAVTVQHVTAHKVLPRRLAAANERLRGLTLGNFCLVREALHLGDCARQPLRGDAARRPRGAEGRPGGRGGGGRGAQAERLRELLRPAALRQRRGCRRTRWAWRC